MLQVRCSNHAHNVFLGGVMWMVMGKSKAGLVQIGDMLQVRCYT
jgi:hypothetical protein